VKYYSLRKFLAICLTLSGYHWLSGAVELSNPSSEPVSICGPMSSPRRHGKGRRSSRRKASSFCSARFYGAAVYFERERREVNETNRFGA
ncbi:hypothetical protein MTP99_009167, partial [Tenebrio molitor]